MTLLTLPQYACFSKAVPFYARGVYIRFDDLQDAVEAKEILEHQEFIVEYISAYDYSAIKGQETCQLDEFEGQIRVTIMIEPHPNHTNFSFSNEDLAVMIKSVDAFAGVFGTLRNCVHVDSNHAKLFLEFRLEFYSIDAANRAIQSLRADPVWGMSDDVSIPTPSLHLRYTDSLQQTFQWCTVDACDWVGELAMNSPHRNKPGVDDKGRLLGYRVTENDRRPLESPRAFHHPHDQHNRVRREGILDGSDVRTTIMLRNIPNKVDWVCHISFPRQEKS